MRIHAETDPVNEDQCCAGFYHLRTTQDDINNYNKDEAICLLVSWQETYRAQYNLEPICFNNQGCGSTTAWIRIHFESDSTIKK